MEFRCSNLIQICFPVFTLISSVCLSVCLCCRSWVPTDTDDVDADTVAFYAVTDYVHKRHSIDSFVLYIVSVSE